MFKQAGLIAVFGAFSVASASAQSLNLYGNTGLIDMPSAGAQGDGTIATTFAGFDGVSRVTVDFQIAPRVEGSFRYGTMTGIDGAGVERTDQQFDLKFILAEEGEFMPAIALGFRDLVGSGANAAEYLVASKNLGEGLTLTGGLGWGRLGSEAAFDNPFGGARDPIGSDRLRGDFFKGDDIGLFGGVEWELPKGGWRIKAEYSSDSYALESGNGARDIASPWNFGIEKDLIAGLDAGLYYLNGSDIAFRLSFTADPNRANAPQDFLPGPTTLVPRTAKSNMTTTWLDVPGIKDKVFTALGEALAPEGIIVDGGTVSGTSITINIINTKFSRAPKAIGRSARVMAVALPPSIETFHITLVESGVPTTTTTVRRSEMERLVNTFEAVPESWEKFARNNAVPLPGDAWMRDDFPSLVYSISPQVPFGLTDGGLSFDVLIDASATYAINRNLSFSGQVTQSLLQGFSDDSSVPGPLPQVRSNYAAFSSDGPVLERLTGDYVTKLAPNVYARASVGYLERMYGGISTEVLYKDATSPFAYGLEVNYAMQRDPENFLSFGDYDVVTGLGSLYWESGWNGVNAQLDAGRYLAGDWGATLTVGRRFRNGWEVSAFVTKTDADTSASDGSFDKGIFLTIPLQWTTPFPTKRQINVPFADFSRDDGARLFIDNRLYPLVRETDEKRLGDNWEAFWQ